MGDRYWEVERRCISVTVMCGFCVIVLQITYKGGGKRKGKCCLSVCACVCAGNNHVTVLQWFKTHFMFCVWYSIPAEEEMKCTVHWMLSLSVLFKDYLALFFSLSFFSFSEKSPTVKWLPVTNLFIYLTEIWDANEIVPVDKRFVTRGDKSRITRVVDERLKVQSQN